MERPAGALARLGWPTHCDSDAAAGPLVACVIRAGTSLGSPRTVAVSFAYQRRDRGGPPEPNSAKSARRLG